MYRSTVNRLCSARRIFCAYKIYLENGLYLKLFFLYSATSKNDLISRMNICKICQELMESFSVSFFIGSHTLSCGKWKSLELTALKLVSQVRFSQPSTSEENIFYAKGRWPHRSVTNPEKFTDILIEPTGSSLCKQILVYLRHQRDNYNW